MPLRSRRALSALGLVVGLVLFALAAGVLAEAVMAGSLFAGLGAGCVSTCSAVLTEWVVGELVVGILFAIGGVVAVWRL